MPIRRGSLYRISDEMMNQILNSKTDDQNFFGGLSPMNTVGDFVAELYDGLFRDILGDETMDRALGSFDSRELFKVMGQIFLQDANRKLFMQAYEQN